MEFSCKCGKKIQDQDPHPEEHHFGWGPPIEYAQDGLCGECYTKQKDEIAIFWYKEGIIEGMRRYAWWKDGVQYVGTCGTTLEEAIKKVKEANYTVHR